MELDFVNTKNSSNRTDFLIRKRNFWTGFSSVLDVFATKKKFNKSKSGKEADFKAIKSDWEMIGSDFKNAMRKIYSEEFE
ncbi:MAG: hypothetical protein ABGW99_05565 [Zunongwangia sp.]|uniref:hypothetical protein n=1 Tax=Zunongwangia sp. TaxID=1965325 RepID=UPI003242AF2C